MTERSEGAGQPDEPSRAAGRCRAQHTARLGRACLQTALAGAEAAKPTGGEAQGAGAKALTPLAFLRAVMRHRDTPVHLRLRVASILAPYLHARADAQRRKAKLSLWSKTNIDSRWSRGSPKNLMDTQKALHDLPVWWTKGEGSFEEQRDVLRKRLALAKKSLRCPETYRWEDLAKDNGRLSQLAAKREAQGLTPPEDAEEIHLTARTFSHENSAEHAERERRRDRRNALYAKWKDYSITEAEQQEFDDLRASLRVIDPDPVRWDFHHQLWLEARIRGLPEPTTEEADKMLAAKRSSADIIRDPSKPTKEWQAGSRGRRLCRLAARGGQLPDVSPAQGGVRALPQLSYY